MLSGTELLVVVLAVAALVAMTVAALVGIVTRLGRAAAERNARSPHWARRLGNLVRDRTRSR